jgi:hypothetical protein
MKSSSLQLQPISGVHRGDVIGFADNGAPLVCTVGDGAILECELLRTGEKTPPVRRGDLVMLWRSPESDVPSVILGRVGPSRPDLDAIPDVIVLEAKQSLTIACGSGSITIRADGKILVKGKDLVSHATRLNRIKGGAVQIN